MTRKVIVLGGGSAGCMAALALRRKLPQVQVVMIRSSEIGVIGVGEGATPGLTLFLHQFLGLSVPELLAETQPVWKLGTRFIWGTRNRFFFPFAGHLDRKLNGLPRNNAYYCTQEMEDYCPYAAMMAQGRVFAPAPDGKIQLPLGNIAYHFENEKLVGFLEKAAVEAGVQIMDDKVARIEQDENGISRLILSGGGEVSADLYVDCSGFASLLLGKTLQEPFVSYKSTLFCDRAVVGGWPRTDEPILPYTTAETMDAGWCWQIEHRDRINRGYVFSSSFLSDEEAEKEFRDKNPRLGATRIVKFVAGRYERTWVKNVVAIGNSSGFVEPLEATSLAVIAARAQLLVETLIESDLDVPQVQKDLFNRHTAEIWDSIRRFLAVHYKFNRRLDTPFWKHCRENIDLAGAEKLVEYYRQAGPSAYWASAITSYFDVFGMAGYLTLLVGQNAPCERHYEPSAQERSIWSAFIQQNRQMAARAITTEQAWEMLMPHREMAVAGRGG